jgi:hypothetical protein
MHAASFDVLFEVCYAEILFHFTFIFHIVYSDCELCEHLVTFKNCASYI